MSNKFELNDTEIATIIKTALEYNASIIRYASFIYGQNPSPKTQRKWVKDFRNMDKEYSDKIKSIIGEEA